MDCTIPDDWLAFCEVDAWTRGSDCYPYQPGRTVEIILLADIEPPRRDAGMAPFEKYKMCPVLFAFQSPECALPEVVLEALPEGGQYQYRLYNGFHRYYASLHVGYAYIPAVVR